MTRGCCEMHRSSPGSISIRSDRVLRAVLRVRLGLIGAQTLVIGVGVGSVSLSPRGAWSMPSDAFAAAWMRKIETL